MLDCMQTASISRTRIPKLPLSSALRWSIGLSVLLTVVLITLLTIRMSAGADPALGPKIVRQARQASASQTTQQTQPVLPSIAVPDEESESDSEAPVQQVPAPVTQAPVAPVQTTTS
jgi:hypothetical protein